MQHLKDELQVTTKIMARDAALDVHVFTQESAPLAAKNTVTGSVTLHANLKHEAGVQATRGAADYAACAEAYGADAAAPVDAENAALFAALEQQRTGLLGAVQYAGVKQNIAAMHAFRWQARNWQEREQLAHIPLEEMIGALLWEEVHGEPFSVSELALSSLGKIMRKKAGNAFAEMAASLKNPQQFTQHARTLLSRLGVLGSEESLEDEAGEEGEPGEMQAPQQQGDASEQQQAEAAEQQHATGDVPRLSGAEERAENSNSTEEGEQQDAAPAEGDAEQEHDDEAVITRMRYNIFTTQYDEEVHATELADAVELARLRERLDAQLQDMQALIARLAMRLQRKILSTQMRHWHFHQEEGVLDPNKLVPLVVDGNYPYPYRQEKEAAYVNTVVTLLLDNSGSMRGRPITNAALVADILSRTLERCGVRVEILGFTTKAWKGGESRKHWEKEGAPISPGRLNDIRHIVYKAADRPHRQCRSHLGLMLKEGVLKENIDGEALLWAHQRLMQRFEERKILLVISDGAPVDDSTLSANPSNYLDQHLHHVIAQIEAQHAMELLAIGIGHDVSAYYQNAVMIKHVEELGKQVVEKLEALFV